MGDTLTYAIAAHFVGDWFLQNHWMAINKSSLKHVAAWVHSGIHVFLLFFVLPPAAAVAIGITHLLIDTRVPLKWWRAMFRQTRAGDAALHVAIWQDQIAHILILIAVIDMMGMR